MLGTGVGGERHRGHRAALVLGQRADAPDQVIAAEPRHLDVAHQDVRRAGAEARQRLVARSHRLDLGAEPRDQGRDQLA